MNLNMFSHFNSMFTSFIAANVLQGNYLSTEDIQLTVTTVTKVTVE